jgi:transcription antitermination protein NusB
MANRHLARSTVLQALYEWDFGGQDDSKADDMLKRNADEFAPGMTDMSFMDKLMKGVLSKRPDLDKIIEKAAPDWPINKISVVDRNILRIGLYELLFASRAEVPAKVAINEAIELAKSYGGETSSRFVNGVLGAVYKEMGEPGKNETSKRKMADEKITNESLGGAVVFARHEGDVYLALVHDIFGHWTLSKGKIGDNPDIAGETPEQGTVREIKEELGLDIEIKEKLDENEYIAYNPETGKKRKHVTYFLAETKYQDLRPEEKGGLDDAQWFKLKDILELNFYNDILPIITKAINLILSKYSK